MRRAVLGAIAVLLAVGALLVVSAITEWPHTTVRAEAETRAPADLVWEALVGFEDYDEWNPFVTSGSGVAREGADVELTIVPVGREPQQVTAEIVILRPVRKLRLQARLLAPGDRDRELEVLLEPAGSGRLVVVGTLRTEGLLVPFGGTDGFDEGLALMLAALVERAERLSQA